MGFSAWVALSFAASFTTPQFDAEVSVKNDGNATVQETIALDFTKPQSSFQRTLPLNSEGRSLRYQFVSARIKQGKRFRNVQFELSHNTDSTFGLGDATDFIVKIGDAGHQFQAHTVFWLTYKVSGALNYENNRSWFVWRAIPFQWPTSIGKSSIAVHYDTDSLLIGQFRIGPPHSGTELDLDLSHASSVLPGKILAKLPSRSELTATTLQPLAAGKGLTLSLWFDPHIVAECHGAPGTDCLDGDGVLGFGPILLLSVLLLCTVIPFIGFVWFVLAQEKRKLPKAKAD